MANDNVWKIVNKNTKNTKGASDLDCLTGQQEGWSTVITIKNPSMMGENDQDEWEDIFMGMRKAANQYPEQIKIVIED